MTVVSVEVFGEEVLKRRLLRIAHDVTNNADAFQRIARLLDRAAAAQFASDGGYGGATWAALAESTIANKQRLGLDLRILRATHALMDSLTGHGAGHIEEITPDFLRWGSDVEYGKFHMTGTSRMPARPPMRLSPQDRRMAVKELQRSIFGGR